jgi:hypothetical protein
MKSKTVGLIILLVVCEVIGVAVGQLFFGLFTQTVPPAVLTSFNKGTAHAAFITYGLGVGVVICVMSVVTVAGSRLFR